MNQETKIPDFFNNFKICSPDIVRLGQEERGTRMARKYQSQVEYQREVFFRFSGEWIIPLTIEQDSVILYFHGGAYVAGNLIYARGLGSALAVHNNCKVFSVGYRVAPEAPYPAAIQDGMAAYQYLLEEGISAQKIVFAGESSGGGLAVAIVLKARDMGLPLPAGVVAFSPWLDLTLQGESVDNNEGKDPSLKKEVLEYFAHLYGEKLDNPYISPIYGDLSSLPPMLLFAGGDELLRSDAERLFEKLIQSGGRARLNIAPGLWHAYILYGGKKGEEDHALVREFIQEICKVE